ncbi:excisionase family protein [Cedecea sp. P7760]|uniref:excisionase family protein n=1 Tax=Cedecea sp. P7760 TaxID=2726983 RepID=UPI0015A14837|nr:excisionase family protein [Cedecea sp. P7760]NWC63690.1 excisionase family protein [Cedecea sp. P7760]
MSEVIQLVPNKWVTEEKLMQITGLREGTIKRARKASWMQGRQYLHVSPEGEPKPTSECMYNLAEINVWIERQASNQPGAVARKKA